MKIVIFTHSSFSHVNAIENIVKSLCEQNEVYCFLEEENINMYGPIKNLHYVAYNKLLDEKLRELLQTHNNFIEKKEVSTIKEIIEEVKHPYEYMLEGSMLYVEDLIPIIKEINPQYILRDACSLFGRIIADKLNIPVIGYTTSPMFTDKFMKTDLRKYFSYSLKRDLSIYNDAQIETLYFEMKKEFEEICAKFEIRPLPLNYLTSPDEEMNFCFGSIELNFISQDEVDRYMFMRPKIFSSDNIADEKRDTIVVSSGSIISFPVKLYNYIVNAFKNESYMVEISQKYYGTNVFILNNLPANIHFQNYFNQTELLKKSLLLITHGGYNSILESIFFEVPILTYAVTHDQFINSRKVEELNIGVDLRKLQLSGCVINKITNELIKSNEVKDSICDLKKKILQLREDEVKRYLDMVSKNE